MISSVPGIGKKTAQRIIIELKDKLTAPGMGGGERRAASRRRAHAEARDALLAMGFAPVEASAALAGLEGDDRPCAAEAGAEAAGRCRVSRTMATPRTPEPSASWRRSTPRTTSRSTAPFGRRGSSTTWGSSA